MQRFHYGEGIAVLIRESSELWLNCSDDGHCLTREYTRREQREREIAFDERLRRAEDELRSASQNSGERAEMRSRIAHACAQFAAVGLDLEAETLALLRGPFAEIGFALAQRARSLDPEVSMSDILQACRNAWTACGLQPLFGRTIGLTDAIFAYSMLYPYSDNYMDDPEVSSEAKLAFSMRFKRRLLGERVAASNKRERAVWMLVELIERQYSRDGYPQVYDSLLAIHGAQEESLAQVHSRTQQSEEDLARLSCAKGGASVLADAILAAGSLDYRQAQFAFAWGVLLQLADDLQDIRDDLQRGSATIFSRAAMREPLDRPTSRAFHFAEAVLNGMERLEQGSAALKGLLRQSSLSVLIRAAANASEFFTRGYLDELEKYSPLAFEFLRERQDQVARRQVVYANLFEALLAGESFAPAPAPQPAELATG